MNIYIIILSTLVTGISCIILDVAKALSYPLNNAGNSFFNSIRRVSWSHIMSPDGEFSDINFTVNRLIEAMRNHKGFTVLFMFGALYVIIMLVSGFCVMICRFCGNCGSNPPAMDPPKASLKRALLAGLLFLLLLGQLLSAFMIQANNSIFYYHLRSNNSNENFFERFEFELKNINVALNELFQKVLAVKPDSDYTTRVKKAIKKCNKNISVELKHSFDRLANGWAFKRLIYSATNLKAKLTKSRRNDYKNQFQKLFKDLNILSNDLDIVKKDLNDYICKDNACTKAMIAVQEITLSSSYRINEKLINAVTNDNFVKNLELIINMMDHFDSSNEKFVEKLENFMDPMKDQINFKTMNYMVGKLIHRLFISITYFLNKISINNSTEMKQFITRMDTYRFFLWLSIFMAVIILWFLYSVGFLFGICGKRGQYDNQSCTRHEGARFLIIGVILSFFVAPFLMIIVISSMTSFGFVQSGLCPYAKSESKLGLVVLDIYVNQIFASQGYRLPKRDVAQSILGHCKDKNVLSAFLQSTMINSRIIQKAIDHWDTFEYETVMKNLHRTSEIIKGIKWYSNNLIDEISGNIMKLSNAINYINQEKLSNELAKQIGMLTRFKHEFEKINGDFVDPKLLQVANTYEYFIKFIPYFLRKLSIETRTNLELNVKQMLNDSLFIAFKDIKCTMVREEVLSIIDFSCNEVLPYLNGSWYGLGLFLLLLIPTIFIALLLNNLYNRIQPYYKDMPEPNYDQYLGFYARPDGENFHNNVQNNAINDRPLSKTDFDRFYA